MSSSHLVSTSSLTFTQGFILGQLSFLLIVLLFVRYVVFSPSSPQDTEAWHQQRKDKHKRAVLSTTSVPAPAPALILGKTGYEMATHAAESADWLNVVFAQVLQGYRNDMLSGGGEEGARTRVEKWLNPEGGSMSWLDPIQVTGLSLGNAYPLLSNARIRPADGQGRIRAEIDVDYLDAVSLSLSTSVLINFPRPRFAVLPVALGVELQSIGGTLSLQLHDPIKGKQHVHVSLLPDFHLNLKTSSLLGSRAKLQDIPKLEQLIISRLRAVIQDRLVHPNHISLTLPSLFDPSISPIPILNDLGEGAVNAMGEALSQGFSQMVGDLSGGALSIGQDEPGDSVSAVAEQAVPVQVAGEKRQRRIPMPAGFPGASTMSTNTPLPTPGHQPQRQTMDTRQNLHSNQQHPAQQRPATISRSGSYLQTQTGRTTSTAPSSSAAAGQRLDQAGDQHFRFSGQFASQPGTPGLGGVRQLGVLNSRAG